MCSDKKAAGINFLLGRGKTVLAEANIPASVLLGVLRVRASAIAEVVTIKNLLGSAIAFAPGFLNAQVANVLAGVFVATGQDIAQVVESSMGVFLAEAEADGSLHVSLTLPCLEVGTVGGGTELAYARRSLGLMGCSANDLSHGTQAKKFAEIVAGTGVAGEVSLLACLAEGKLGRAHARYRAQNHPMAIRV